MKAKPNDEEVARARKRLPAGAPVNPTGQAAAELDALLPAVLPTLQSFDATRNHVCIQRRQPPNPAGLPCAMRWFIGQPLLFLKIRSTNPTELSISRLAATTGMLLANRVGALRPGRCGKEYLNHG